MDADLAMKPYASESGISLIETMVAMLVVMVAAIGLAGTFLHGMRLTTSSPSELIATQKAAEAIESVFSARDSHTITWDQLKNKSKGGIFLDEQQDMNVAGEDGIVNTGDHGEVLESLSLPGPDQKMGTADDTIDTLAGYKRQIVITQKSDEDDLREITVIVTYTAGSATHEYKLTAYISSYA
jgi:hypothetical protein